MARHSKVVITVTKEEHNDYKQRAAELGISMAEYIRRCVRDEIISNRKMIQE